MRRKVNGTILIETALEAYNTLKEYCKQQDDCCGCLLVVSENGLDPDCCLMHLGNPPGNWQDLEL